MSMTQSEFNETFGDMMLHGLDSNSTYIPLRTNKTLGINVAIRPFVQRLSDNIVLFSAKLRVGYTMDESHNILKKSITDISEDVAAERLRDFCKGFKWLKADARRFSTIVGFAVAATVYDGEQAAIALEESNLAAEFINRLENKYQQYNNDVGFGPNKRKAIQALNAAWALQSSNVFTSLPATTQLPDMIVGMQSGVLNQAQKGYDGNVLSFEAKVAEKAAEAAAAAAEAEAEVNTEETTDSE